VIKTLDNKYKLIDTMKFLVSKTESYITSNFIGNTTELELDESTIFVKDPFSNELILFKLNKSKYYMTADRLAIRQLRNLNKLRSDNESVFTDRILYVTDGLAIVKEDVDASHQKVNYFFTDLPGTPSDMSYTDIDEDNWTPNYINEVQDKDLTRDNITPITPSLVFVKVPNNGNPKEYLIEVESDYNNEPNILKMCHIMTIHRLREDGSFSNLDKLSKDYTSELIGATLLNLSSDGCLWYGKDNNNGTCYINKL
jgi:hypothetical protein